MNELFEGDKVGEAMRTADVAVAAYSADAVRSAGSRAEHRERQDAYARGLAASGELTDHFAPGVYDPEGRLSDDERAAAEKLAETDGVAVYLDGDAPVATVKRSASDEGTATVFVALEDPTPQAVEQALDRAAERAGGSGELVVDGRLAGLTVEAAQAGCDAALVDGVRMPERVHCVLDDDRVYRWP